MDHENAQGQRVKIPLISSHIRMNPRLRSRWWPPRIGYSRDPKGIVVTGIAPSCGLNVDGVDLQQAALSSIIPIESGFCVKPCTSYKCQTKASGV
jgi:hypothetical protein